MRTVVAGVDGDGRSAHVLARALVEARTSARPLQVLHAWSAPTWASAAAGLDDPDGVARGTAAAERLAVAALAEAVGASGYAAPVPATVRGAHGDAGRLLVQRSGQAGLLVIGTRSHGSLVGAALGAATGVVLRRAACPVMVVPPGTAPLPFRRVVLGYDDPTRAGSALRWALDAARRHQCPVVVVHVLPRTPSPVSRSAQVDDARREDEVRTWLAHHVARAARSHADVPVTTGAADGTPFDVLLRAAGPDDLLVLGSRAHPGVAEAVLGAVAVACAEGTAGTVVVVRAGQERLDDVVPPSPGALRVAAVRGPAGTLDPGARRHRAGA